MSGGWGAQPGSSPLPMEGLVLTPQRALTKAQKMLHLCGCKAMKWLGKDMKFNGAFANLREQFFPIKCASTRNFLHHSTDGLVQHCESCCLLYFGLLQTKNRPRYGNDLLTKPSLVPKTLAGVILRVHSIQ
jgi:hypothetical protein